MESAKGKINFIIGVLGAVSCFFLNEEIKGTVSKISIGLLCASIIDFIVFLYENRKRWKLLQTKIWKRNVPVRITVAYLFRININGKYLLIKRHKTDFVGFQPVGGAYKYFTHENREIFDKIGITPCNHVPRDEDTEDDLRVIINQRKKLLDFLKWFDSKKNREIDPRREFHEELIEPGYLPFDLFKHFKYLYIGCHKEGVLRTEDYSVDQFRYADIFELRIEDDNQKKALQNLASKEDIYLASAEEIRKGSTNNGIRILPHTFKILPK